MWRPCRMTMRNWTRSLKQFLVLYRTIFAIDFLPKNTLYIYIALRLKKPLLVWETCWRLRVWNRLPRRKELPKPKMGMTKQKIMNLNLKNQMKKQRKLNLNRRKRFQKLPAKRRPKVGQKQPRSPSQRADQRLRQKLQESNQRRKPHPRRAQKRRGMQRKKLLQKQLPGNRNCQERARPTTMLGQLPSKRARVQMLHRQLGAKLLDSTMDMYFCGTSSHTCIHVNAPYWDLPQAYNECEWGCTYWADKFLCDFPVLALCVLYGFHTPSKFIFFHEALQCALHWRAIAFVYATWILISKLIWIGASGFSEKIYI